MFMNRIKFSALALGVVVSALLISSAVAADDTKRADINASEQLEQQLRITDGSNVPALQDRRPSVYQGASMSVPRSADANANKWFERQLRITDGNPDGQ